MQHDVLIQADTISYHVGGSPLLQDLTCTIYKNQIVSLVGYNGSGKSTLVKLLLGTITPTHGTITRKASLQIGYLPQKVAFVQQLPLTVRDFLGIYNTDLSARSAFSCELLEVDSLLDRPLSGLSGGQLQKVLIYNALLGDPELLLLDEPVASLDVRAQEDFYALLEHLHQEHQITIVLVSHDMHSVYRQSDLVICLHKGVCCTGSPDDAAFSAELEALGPSYLLPYLHTHTHDSDG